MSVAIAKQEPGSEWNQERVDLVKRTVCPKGISNDEFALFIEQCKRSGLDPLIKEAYCVPRNKNIGRKDSPQYVTVHEFQPSEAGMLVRAERFPDFRGIAASAVYTDDQIAIDAGAGTVSHVFNPTKKRGPLLGAWCRLLRDGKVAIVVWLDLAAYSQNTPLWGKMPATMMEKCARVGALRKAYPAAFGGLYIREEMPAEEFDYRAVDAGTERPALPPLSAQMPPAQGKRGAEMKAQLAARSTTVDATPAKPADPVPVTTHGEPPPDLKLPSTTSARTRRMPPIQTEPEGPPEPPPMSDDDYQP